MLLEWEEFVGSGTQKAKGFCGTYISFRTNGTTRLYLMRHGITLCPINKERAEAYYEFASEEGAKEMAQELEDKISSNALRLIGKLNNFEQQKL